MAKSYRKRITIFIGSALVLSLIFMFLQGYYLDKVISPLLKEVVNKYNKNYEINFKKTRINILKSELSIDSFSIFPSPDKLTNLSQIYVTSPRVILNLDNTLNLLLNRELNFSSIYLKQPKIQVIKGDPATKIDVGKDINDLYKLVAGYLDLFKINNFEIEHGNIQFTLEKGQEPIEINDASLKISNFELDSANNLASEKFFFKSDIQLTLFNQAFVIDKKNYINFKEFHISTLDSTVTTKEFKWFTKNEKLVKPDNILPSVFLPQLQISGVDFKALYFDRDLSLNKIIIKNPGISLQPSIGPSNKADSINGQGHRSPFLGGIFKEISIKDTEIDSGFLYIDSKKNEYKRTLEINKLNTTIIEFFVDSLGQIKKEYFSWFKELRIGTGSNFYRLPDQLHIITLDGIKLNSQRGDVTFENVLIYPDSTSNKYTLKDISKVQARIPQLKLTNFNYNKFFSADTLDIEGVYLVQPDIHLIRHPKKIKAGPKNFAHLIDILYDNLKPAFEALYLQEFNISDGNINIEVFEPTGKHHFDFHGVELEIERLNFDSTFTEAQTPPIPSLIKKLSVQDFNLLTRNEKISIIGKDLFYDYSNSQLGAGSSEIVINKIDSLGNSSPFITIKHDKVAISNIVEDIHGKKRSFKLDSVLLESPEINVYLFKKDKNREKQHDIFIEAFINSLAINNGKINIYEGGAIKSYLDELDLTSNAVQLKQDSPWNYMLPDKFSIKTGKGHFHNSTFSIDFDKTYKRNNFIEIEKPVIHHAKRDTLLFDAKKILIDLSSELKSMITDNQYNIKSINMYGPNIKHRNTNCKNSFEPEKNPIFTVVEKIKSYPSIIIDSTIIIGGSAYFSTNNCADSLYIKHFDLHGSLFDNKSNKPFPLQALNASIQNLHIKNNNETYSSKRINIEYNPTNQLHNVNFDSLQISFPKDGTSSIAISSMVPSLEISSMSFDSLINPTLTINGNMSITQPSISLHILRPKDTIETNKNKKAPFQYLIDLDIFKISKALLNLTIENPSGKVSSYQLKDFKLLLKNLSYFPGVDIEKLIYSEGMDLKMGAFEFTLPDSIYSMRFEDLQIDGIEKSIYFTNLYIFPSLKKMEIGPFYQKQIDWLNFYVYKLKLERVDFSKFYEENAFFAKKIIIDSAHIQAFRDKNIPIDDEQKKMLPQYYLKHFGMPIKIDSVIMKSSYIQYEELAKDATKPGTVSFEKIHATLTNLNNTDTSMQATSNLNMTTKVYGEILLQSNVAFDLNDPNQSFSMTAIAHESDMLPFNRFVYPCNLLEIKNGKIKGLKFDVVANDDFGIGFMELEYNDLKIRLIHQKKHNTKGMGPTLGSFFANTFIINRNNPKWFNLTVGDVFYERDKKKSIFNYWTKLLLSGIVSSIGAKNNKSDIKKIMKDRLDEMTTDSEFKPKHK